MTEIEQILQLLPSLSESELREIAPIIDELERRERAERCRNDLLEFCKLIDPEFIVGAHHKKLAELLMDIAEGRKDRIAVSVPPRHGKS